MARDLADRKVAVVPFRPSIRHQLTLIRPANDERSAESEAFAEILREILAREKADLAGF